MKHAPYGLAALSLLGLGLAPSPAQASEIQFYMTTRDSPGACIILTGPWFRSSGPVRLTNNTANVLVYSAEVNLFSPIGEWAIQRLADCNEEKRLQTETFCVPEASPVRLTVASNVIHTGAGFPRCGGGPAASDGYQALGGAYLGDEPARPAAPAAAQATAAATAATTPGPSALGGDRFRFAGRAGDTVEVVLDRDGARGSDGKLARLRLRAAGGTTLGEREGAVPLKLKATLRAAGSYVIEVAEVADGPGGEAFRGYYQLGVDSASNAEILLEPLDSVEP